MTETGGLQILEESGAYRRRASWRSSASGITAPGDEAEARRIAALPVAQRGPVLFNRVYGVGNPTKMREFNNTGPNDGWLYRGGGMMQATGKSNYAAMAKKTGLPLVEHPEMLHSRTARSWRPISNGRRTAAATPPPIATTSSRCADHQRRLASEVPNRTLSRQGKEGAGGLCSSH
jgi:hypothetical protein